MQDNGVYVVGEDVSRTVGKDAQRNNILAAKVVADIVKTTLGPRGMDKMLVDSAGGITVTNDGVTILEEMEIDHPAAKMMVEIAKTQESEVGDGTTSAALIAGSLLENAEKLLDRKIHPTTIVKGYKVAAEKCLNILGEISVPLQDDEVLKNIARTAMTGKGAEGSKDKLSDLLVRAVNNVSSGREVDLDDIKIEKLKGMEIGDSGMVEGVVLGKDRANSEMVGRVEDARILLVDFPLEIKSPEQETRISINSPEQMENFVRAEEKFLKDMTDEIVRSGANVVFCQKGIDDVAQYYLAKAGIYACRRVTREDMEALARATGGKILSSLGDLEPGIFGRAGEVEEIKIGDEALTYVRGCKNPRSVSLVLRGGTDHVLDEIERSVKDALGDIVSAFKSGKVVAGGGAVEVELGKRLRSFAKTIGGREQLAIEEFSNALESIPETLAENAGLDPIDIMAELKKRHESGGEKQGLNLFKNEIEDTLEAGIVEPEGVKRQAISSASEVAMMILRIDDVLISSGSQQGGGAKHGMHKGMSSYEGMD